IERPIVMTDIPRTGPNRTAQALLAADPRLAASSRMANRDADGATAARRVELQPVLPGGAGTHLSVWRHDTDRCPVAEVTALFRCSPVRSGAPHMRRGGVTHRNPDTCGRSCSCA